MKILKTLLLGVVVSLGIPACNDNNEVVATGVAGNDFFITWQITSSSQNNAVVSCAQAGATRVTMHVVKTDTGVATDSAFNCDDHQGLSGQLAPGGNYDVTINLVNAAGLVISTQSRNNQNITISGTVDLGLITFSVP